MKILHFGYFMTIPPGIRNQLFSEVQSGQRMQKLGIRWDTVFFCLENPYGDDFIKPSGKTGFKFIDYFKLRFAAQNWLKLHLEQYDYILFRYSVGDLVSLFNLPLFNHVMTIHHTYELEEIKNLLSSFTGALKFQVERIAGYLTLRRVKGVLGVTPELVDYEIRRIPRRADLFTWHYPNGIHIEEVALAEDRRDGPPALLMVAGHFTPWQGVDLVIDKLEQTSRDFILYIVGSLPETYLEKINNDPRYVYHGFLDRKQIREVAGRCDLGLTSFALFRKGMTQACTLKTREYLALGLPVYSGHEDPAFPKNFSYYKHASTLDVDSLLDTAIKLRQTPRETVRQGAIPFIDKFLIMEKLSNALSKL